MKTPIIASALMAITILNASCKKEDPDNDSHFGSYSNQPNAQLIPGIWEGSYGYGVDSTTYYYSFRIFPDGTLEERNANNIKVGEGIWTVFGNTFYSTYHSFPNGTATYSVKAAFNPITHRLSGTWGHGNNDSNAGSWFMTEI